MRKAIIAMVIMFLVVVWPLGGLWEIILRPIIGGGAEQAFFYPLYVGVILPGRRAGVRPWRIDRGAARMNAARRNTGCGKQEFVEVI